MIPPKNFFCPVTKDYSHIILWDTTFEKNFFALSQWIIRILFFGTPHSKKIHRVREGVFASHKGEP